MVHSYVIIRKMNGDLLSLIMIMIYMMIIIVTTKELMIWRHYEDALWQTLLWNEDFESRCIYGMKTLNHYQFKSFSHPPTQKTKWRLKCKKTLRIIISFTLSADAKDKCCSEDKIINAVQKTQNYWCLPIQKTCGILNHCYLYCSNEYAEYLLLLIFVVFLFFLSIKGLYHMLEGRGRLRGNL
jgi:hypothetical protein